MVMCVGRLMETCITIQQTGFTWSVFVNGRYVEGGYLFRKAAEQIADAYFEQATKAIPVGILIDQKG